MLKYLCVVVSIVLGGCCVQPMYVPPATYYRPTPPKPKLPTDAERKALIEAHDFGPEPAQAELARVAPALKNWLRDPDSLKDLAFGQPYKEMLWNDREPYDAKYRFVWRVPFQFRARNGFGGYNLQQGCADFEQGKFTGLWVD